MAQRLATLSSLRTLRAHLRPEVAIHPSSSAYDAFTSGPHYLEGTLAELHQTATALLRELPHSDVKLWLLQREGRWASWRLFCRAIKQDIDQQIEAELDPAGGLVSMTRFSAVVINSDVVSFLGYWGVRPWLILTRSVVQFESYLEW